MAASHRGFHPPGAALLSGPLIQCATLATWSILRNRRRVAVALGSVIFGIVALVLAGGFIEWILFATREGTITSRLGHIVVAKKGFQEHGQSDLGAFLLPAAAAELDWLRQQPGVRTVAPRRMLTGLVSHGEVTFSFLAEAVDPNSERDFSDYSIIVRGADLAQEEPYEVIVGHGLAANLGADVGDKVVLLANKPGGGVNGVEARVRGIFATISKAYDDSAIRMPLNLSDKLLSRPGTHKWVVVLRNTDDTSVMTNRLREHLQNRGFEVTPWYDLADFYHKTVGLLSRQMIVMQIIIGVIIVLIIGNSMMMGVVERTSEIGTSMALGSRRIGVLFQFLLEGILLGFIGGTLGVGLGVILGKVISIVGIPMPPPPGRSQGFRAEIFITGHILLSSLTIAVSAALVAALYPSWRASRIPIVDALRHNR